VWVLVFLTAYNQFENYVLGPRIARITLKIHPAITIGAVFAGGLLFGGVGAVLALPAAAVIQASISTYAEEHRVIDNELTQEPKVHKRFRRLRGIRLRNPWGFWRRPPDEPRVSKRSSG
jgi:predicted PurR-regulated permease PerM